MQVKVKDHKRDNNHLENRRMEDKNIAMLTEIPFMRMRANHLLEDNNRCWVRLAPLYVSDKVPQHVWLSGIKLGQGVFKERLWYYCIAGHTKSGFHPGRWDTTPDIQEDDVASIHEVRSTPLQTLCWEVQTTRLRNYLWNGFRVTIQDHCQPSTTTERTYIGKSEQVLL